MTLRRINNEKGWTAIESMTSATIIGLISILGFAGYKGVQVVNKYLSTPVVQKANVTGGPENELFIDKDGKRFYAEIDGIPMHRYRLQKPLPDDPEDSDMRP